MWINFSSAFSFWVIVSGVLRSACVCMHYACTMHLHVHVRGLISIYVHMEVEITGSWSLDIFDHFLEISDQISACTSTTLFISV